MPADKKDTSNDGKKKKKKSVERKAKKTAYQTDDAEIEALRKQVAEQKEALDAEEARRIAAEKKAQPTSSRRNKPLVRWDTELDLFLLLAIQTACNHAGIKLPWDRIGEFMGPKFSEGAIVQHLAKLRVKREEEGKPNPPPLKRAALLSKKKGGRRSSPTTPAGTKRGWYKLCDSEPDSGDDFDSDESVPEKVPKRQRKAVSKVSSDVVRVKKEGTVQRGAEDLMDPEGRQFGFTPSSETPDPHLTLEGGVTGAGGVGAEKKSSILTLKMDKDRLAELDRQIGVAQNDWTPPRFFEDAMHDDPFDFTHSYTGGYAVPPSLPGPGSLRFQVAYPSTGPSLFASVNQPETTYTDSPTDFSLGAAFRNLDYPSHGWELPADQTSLRQPEEVQFVGDDDDELFVCLEDVTHRGEVESYGPPKGSEEEETKEY